MPSLTDKTILITGATDGLGKRVAQHLAAEGATLLLHGRNSEKGRKVLDEIMSQSGNTKVKYYNADLASLQELKVLSEAVLKDNSRLDVLINNAAVGGGPKGSAKREVSKDGYELRFAVNYLSQFVLTQNLLPIIITAAPSRIVFVSSIGQAPIDFNDVMMEKSYDSFTAYCRSKLAQIMYGFELAKQLKGKGVVVNSLHPASLMDTNMVHQFFGRTISTIDEGAAVVEYVATSSETATITGAYFNQMKQGNANNQAYNEDTRKKLLAISRELTQKYLL